MADDGCWPAGGAELRARETSFLETTGLAICARVRAGESLSAICAEAGMPHRQTVRNWARAEPSFGLALGASLQAARIARRMKDGERALAPRDPRGRRSTYTDDIAETICERLANGASLVAIVQDPAMPAYGTVLKWARSNPVFADMYAQARQSWADYLFDEAREVALAATPETVWVGRLQFDVIRWQTARAAPRKYVERLLIGAEMRSEQAAAIAAAPAPPAGKRAGQDEQKKLQIVVTQFEKGPDGTVVCIPPRNSAEEALYERVYGKPYDGPYKITDEERAENDAEQARQRRYRESRD